MTRVILFLIIRCYWCLNTNSNRTVVVISLNTLLLFLSMLCRFFPDVVFCFRNRYSIPLSPLDGICRPGSVWAGSARSSRSIQYADSIMLVFSRDGSQTFICLTGSGISKKSTQTVITGGKGNRQSFKMLKQSLRSRVLTILFSNISQ